MPSQIIWLCLVLFSIVRLAHSCAFHVVEPPTHQTDKSALIKANLEYKDTRDSRVAPHVTTISTNVAVFDGLELSGPRTVVIRN